MDHKCKNKKYWAAWMDLNAYRFFYTFYVSILVSGDNFKSSEKNEKFRNRRIYYTASCWKNLHACQNIHILSIYFCQLARDEKQTRKWWKFVKMCTKLSTWIVLKFSWFAPNDEMWRKVFRNNSFFTFFLL